MGLRTLHWLWGRRGRERSGEAKSCFNSMQAGPQAGGADAGGTPRISAEPAGPTAAWDLARNAMRAPPVLSAPCLMCSVDMPIWQGRLMGRIAIPVILQRNHDAAPRKKYPWQTPFFSSLPLL